MLIVHKDSHIDHGLTTEQLAYVLEHFQASDGFFISTITMPEDMGTVPCGLHGPIMGDLVVPSAEVFDAPRSETRKYTSRLCWREPRQVRDVTVIAGPHDGMSCVLYTVFGGPKAPKEPNDPSLQDGEREDSIAFWSEHALSAGA